MKSKAAIIFFSAMVFLRLIGCQMIDKQTSKSQIANRKSFCALAGVWKAQDSPWKIVLSGDGTVSSAVIPMGEVEIKPNQTTKVEMKDGSFSTFKAGDCFVQFSPATRELFVSIELEKIHVKFLDNVITGNSTDRFVGRVSEDGRFWMADWITVFDYGPHFPQEPNDIATVPVIFEKLKD